MELLRIYEKLLSHFGQQNWWPTKTENKRDEIIIGAVLTQATNWQNVEKALENLEKEDLIDLKKLAKLSRRKLENLIRPCGFYKIKAERLKNISKWMAKNPKVLMSNNLERLRQQMLDIMGLGEETVDSILLYAFNKPLFVIDAYTKRLINCLKSKGRIRANWRIDYDSLQKFFMENLPRDVKIYQEFHALIVRLGKEYCKRKPLCQNCPLS